MKKGEKKDKYGRSLSMRKETHSKGPTTTTGNKCKLPTVRSTSMYIYTDIKQHVERRSYVAAGTGLESFTFELIKRETNRGRERDIAEDPEMQPQ